MERADTLLLYGATDTGKTSQLGEIAQWEYAKTGRVSRLISADSGWDPLGEMVASPERPLGTANPDGSVVCVEAWNVQSLRDPWVVWVCLSEGEWPSVVACPVTPQTPLGVRLRMSKSLMRDGWIVVPGLGGKEFEVGQYLLEGLSTFCTTGMQDHINENRKLSEDVVAPFTSRISEVDLGGRETPREVKLAAAGRSHYGHVMRFVLDDLVPRFGRISASRVIWTAHEAKGTDDITGIANSALGPMTIGKAMVDKTTQKFGHSFHLTVGTSVKRDQKGGEMVSRDFRAWFVSHPDEVLTKMNWPAKVSLPIARAKDLLRKYPGGFLPLSNGASMTEFLEFLAGEDAK